MTATAPRPCRSQNPATCPFHRNGVIADLLDKQALIYASGSTPEEFDKYFYYKSLAQTYRWRQEKISVNKSASAIIDLEAVRAEIADDTLNDPNGQPVLPNLGQGKISRSARYLQPGQVLALTGEIVLSNEPAEGRNLEGEKVPMRLVTWKMPSGAVRNVQYSTHSKFDMLADWEVGSLAA